MAEHKFFNKLAAFTDIHYGLKHNSRIHNLDCENFILWFVEEAKKRGCETCIFLGDYHHNRSTVNISTLNFSISGLRILSQNFKRVFLITGNHDLFYREKREISSLVIGEEFPNVMVVNEPHIQDDVAILPWLIDDEWKNVSKLQVKYIFGHFEIPGFKMNAQIAMPDHGGINQRHFKNQDYVFSGHFHHRQASGKVQYIGNPFAHNFGDAWDNDRGAMFLEWNKEPEYVNWEDGPRYITCSLSDLLENTEEYLTTGTYAKITIDLDLPYEDLNFIKDTLYAQYELRELKMIPKPSDEDDIEFVGDISFQSVDQIVHEQLLALDVETFDKNQLLNIYTNL